MFVGCRNIRSRHRSYCFAKNISVKCNIFVGIQVLNAVFPIFHKISPSITVLSTPDVRYCKSLKVQHESENHNSNPIGKYQNKQITGC